MTRDMDTVISGLESLGWQRVADNIQTGETAFEKREAHALGVVVNMIRLTGAQTMVGTQVVVAGEATWAWTDVQAEPIRSAFELLGLDFWNLQGEFVDTAPEGIRLIPDLQEMVDGAELAEKDKPDIVEE